jgi:AcrR family transcriptional regulator
MPVAGAGRRLRADAERNRVRILAAAAEIFAEMGVHATLHDVAARAGVGIGTVYRRFIDKDALIEALLEDELSLLTERARQAAEAPDATSALLGWLHVLGEQQAANRGLHEVLHGSTYGQSRVTAAREELQPIIDGILARAKQQGGVRDDLQAVDLTMITLMLSSMAMYTFDVRSDSWVRYFELIVEAIRARPNQKPLTVAPLTEDELAGVSCLS